MAEVSQVRKVNAAWFKSNGKKSPPQQNKDESSDGAKKSSQQTPAAGQDPGDESPPSIDEFA